MSSNNIENSFHLAININKNKNLSNEKTFTRKQEPVQGKLKLVITFLPGNINSALDLERVNTRI